MEKWQHSPCGLRSLSYFLPGRGQCLLQARSAPAAASPCSGPAHPSLPGGFGDSHLRVRASCIGSPGSQALPHVLGSGQLTRLTPQHATPSRNHLLATDQCPDSHSALREGLCLNHCGVLAAQQCVWQVVGLNTELLAVEPVDSSPTPERILPKRSIRKLT